MIQTAQHTKGFTQTTKVTFVIQLDCYETLPFASQGIGPVILITAS
jgi:hypothetical protein